MTKFKWLIAFCVSVFIASPALAEIPFVAGFERFGRHEEIADQSAGRLLLSELNCTSCHKTDDPLLQPKGGPNLAGAGNRLQREWMLRFLMNPQQTKPGTTMPGILDRLYPEQQLGAAVALSAYLETLEQPFPEIRATGANPVLFEFWKRGDAARGKALYHQVGCVACHEPSEDYDVVAVKPSPLDELLEQLDPEELKEMGLSSAARKVQSIPHSNLAEKYTRQSLTHFLLKPDAVRPDGRMPDFQLTAVDAADISEFLITKYSEGQRIEAPPATAELVAEGRKLFEEFGCVNCHNVKGIATHPAKPLAELAVDAENSCVSSRLGNQPRYVLDEQQTHAIRAAFAPAGTTAKPDALHSNMLKLNCFACHERGGQGGVGRYRRPYFETLGHVDIGDEGRLPPTLSGVGAKLNEKWLTSVLQGKGRVRPHMTIRMPVFPATMTKSLPSQFAAADELASPKPSAEVFAKLDEKSALEAGRLLMDVGCVQCHEFNGETLPGTVGVDLLGVADRIDPQWFHDFLRNPADLKPRTRMPTFFPDGKSANQQILGGDMELQIAAMWAYIKNLSKQPLPQKIAYARSQNYELTPLGKPVVLRTFMPEAGTHAIAVGFPQKVHFALDAETVRLAQGWRGRFLDAEGTWFMRFAPPADPLGNEVLNLSAGPDFAVLTRPEAKWPVTAEEAGIEFRGYRLDAEGVPTFEYDAGGWRIADRIVPNESNGLTRTVTLTRAGSETSTQVFYRVLAGNDLKQLGPNKCQLGAGVVVTSSTAGQLRDGNGHHEWLIPLGSGDANDKATRVEVQYQW
ncbi:MAG: c-type cytochrome [Planctomycetaceae bacterium]|nr:c-type cytochrome [Planctomycetaceae bacterium]